MSGLIKAIETVYHGRRFRSRLEARWAVFYTHIEVPWVYEPDGFVLQDGTHYLPDFWLPDQDAYIEIKPKRPTEGESKKCALLAELTRKTVFLFWGQPGFHTDSGYPPGQIEGDGAYEYRGVCDEECFGPSDNYYTWCVCEHCSTVGITFDGRSARLPCHCHPDGIDKAYTYDHPLLLAGYDAANSHRFESREVSA